MIAERSGNSATPARVGSFPDVHFISAGGDGAVPPALEPGTELGERFTIERLIGIGRVGAVYQARDALRGESVALKLVDAGPVSPRSYAEALRREAALHQAVADYRNVIRVYDLYEFLLGGARLLGLSMEYADGGTLRDWLQVHKEDWQYRQTEGLTLFIQACRGTGAVNDAGITHGDLKPENLVLAGGTVKVTDFGAALLRNADDGPIAWGTPVYASPEQCTAAYPDELDQRSDVYSLGILLHEIVHPKCRPPFAGSHRRLRELHLHVEPPALLEAEPRVARVVARCLQKEPADRYRDVWELLDDLAGCSRESPPRDDPWEQARQSMSDRNFAKATQWCRTILACTPDHADAQHLLSALESRYEHAARLYAAAVQDLEERGVAEALMTVRAAIQIYPQHPDGSVILLRLVARASEYREHLREGRRALLQGSWQTGIARLQQAQQIHRSAPRLGQTIEWVSTALRRIDELREHMTRAIASQERERALALARCMDRCKANLQSATERAANNGGNDERG